MMRSTGNFSPEWGYLAPAPSVLRTVRVVLVATAIGATAGAGVVLSLIDRPTADSDRVAVATHAIVTSAQAAPVQESQTVNGAALIAPLASGTKADARPNVTAASASRPSQPAAAMQAASQQPQQAQSSQVQTAQPEQGKLSAMTAPTAQLSGSQASPVNAAPANETPAASRPGQPAIAALAEPPVAAAAASAPTAVTSDAAAGDQPDQSFVGPQQPPQQKKPRHHTAAADNRDFIGTALRRLFSARAGASYYPSRGL